MDPLLYAGEHDLDRQLSHRHGDRTMILFAAVQEPVVGPSRHFAIAVRGRRFWTEADIK